MSVPVVVAAKVFVERIEAQMRAEMDALAVAFKDELDALKRRVTKLERQLAEQKLEVKANAKSQNASEQVG